MCPYDLDLRIVAEQDQQCLFVAMSMQIQVTLDGEVDHLLHPVRLCRFSVDVEFADAAVIAARIFLPDELEDCRIVEPGLDVVAHPVRPDERHDLQLGPPCVHQFVCTFVGAAGCDNACDAIAAEYVAYLVERIKRFGFLIVMQMRVKNFDLLLCLRRPLKWPRPRST